MRFSFSAEQEEFRATLRRALEARSPTKEVRRLMATDAGFDSGPPPPDSGTGNTSRAHHFKATSDVAEGQGGTWDSQFFVRAGKGTDGKVHIDFQSSIVDQTSWGCTSPPWWDPIWGPTPVFCGYLRRTFTYAFGILPSSSYHSGQGLAYLNATLAASPTLYVSSCTWDDSNWTSTCTSSPSGVVDLRWRSNGWYKSTDTGSHEESYGFFSVRTSGSFTSQGADVTGSVFGLTPDYSFGQLLRTTGGTIQFDSKL